MSTRETVIALPCYTDICIITKRMELVQLFNYVHHLLISFQKKKNNARRVFYVGNMKTPFLTLTSAWSNSAPVFNFTFEF